MAYNIPTLAQLCERARQAFRDHLPGSDAWLPNNNIYVSAKVIAGAVYEIFGFAQYVSLQKFALTADSEHLELHGQELGLARKEARPARLVITSTVPGACAIDAGAECQRSDGVLFKAIMAASTGGAGSLDVQVVAVSNGAAGNTPVGASVTWNSGVTGDVTVAVVSSVQAFGADVEPDGPKFTSDLSTFRGRILFRKRNPPHGGAPADYVDWCGQVPGVTRTFVERRWAGAGTVRVFPLMDGLFTNGIPDGPALQRVRDYLELVAPATAIVTVAAPTPVPVDIQISGLFPNTAAVREAVTAELASAFARTARVAGNDQRIDAMPYLAYPASFSRSWIWQAVANASGEERHAIVTPSGDVPLTAGQMPVIGNVTFVG